MTKLIVPNLDDELRDELRQQADRHGRTIEEEALAILRGAILAKGTSSVNGVGKLGSRIAARFAEVGIEQDIPELRGHIALPPNLER